MMTKFLSKDKYEFCKRVITVGVVHLSHKEEIDGFSFLGAEEKEINNKIVKAVSEYERTFRNWIEKGGEKIFLNYNNLFVTLICY